jgi:hypothetical protein
MVKIIVMINQESFEDAAISLILAIKQGIIFGLFQISACASHNADFNLS